MLYEILISPFIRKTEMEMASKISKEYFQITGKIPGGRFLRRLIHGNRPMGLQREVFDLNFYNPVGLGAGLDSNCNLYNDLNNLGFSFSEVGPLDLAKTRKAVRNIQKDPPADILAACINRDFLKSFTLAYDFCSFFVIEPGQTPYEDALDPILDARLSYETYKPIVFKLEENISGSELQIILNYCLMNGIDGVQSRSLEQTIAIREYTKGRLPIIANCHIRKPQQAAELLEAGADLVELRSALVYDGPGLVRKTLKYLINKNANVQ